MESISSLRKNKKELILSVVAFIYFTVISSAQVPNWLWTEYGGNTNEDIVRAVKADGSGNIYVAGSFQSTSLMVGSTLLTNPNGIISDMFVAKYDNNGNEIWAKNAAGINMSVARAITVDASGNIYVVGYFSDTIILGSYTFLNPGTNALDIFLAKYDSNGNVLWAKSAHGSGDDRVYSVVRDATGNVYITGGFGSSSLTFGSVTLTNPGIEAMYLLKYDSNGNIIWGRSAGGTSSDCAFSVSVDATNNLYVAGNFQSSSIVFGTTTLTNTDNTASTSDLFVVKYDSAGTVIWAKSAGGTNNDYGISNAADAAGNNYITGYYNSNSIPFGSNTINNAGSFDIYLAKYDSNGAIQWGKGMGGSGFDASLTVTTDNTGNIYLGGEFASASISFGSNTFTNSGAFGGDLFITKFDNSGNVLWATSTGGDDDDQVLSLSPDGADNLYAGGGFASSSISFGSSTFTGAGSYDMFVSKLAATATDINEINSFADITISPNPLTSKTYITFSNKFQNNAGGENISIKIKDILGNEIKSFEKLRMNEIGRKMVIDLSGVAKGIYFIQIMDEVSLNPLINKKIVVQ